MSLDCFSGNYTFLSFHTIMINWRYPSFLLKKTYATKFNDLSLRSLVFFAYLYVGLLSLLLRLDSNLTYLPLVQLILV